MLNPIEKTDTVRYIEQAVKSAQGPVSVIGPVDSVKALLVSALYEARWRLVIAADEPRAKMLEKDIRSITGNTWYYPAKDFLFYQADTQGTLITRQRVEVIKHYIEDERGTIVTTIDALMDKIPKREEFSESVLTLEPGAVMELNALATKLTKLGYTRLPEVEAMGEFAIRGGIVDIYPFTSEHPIRVEFWDTEIDNMREFDVESQRSMENVLDRVEIYPATDKAEHRGRNREVSLLDYFGEDAVIILDEPDRLKARGQAVEEEFNESFEARVDAVHKHGKLKDALALESLGMDAEGGKEDPAELIYGIDSIMDRLYGPRTVALSMLGNTVSEFPARQSIRLETADVSAYKSSFDLLRQDLTHWQQEQYEVILLAASRTRASRLAQQLRDYDLRAYCPDENEKEQEENRGAIKVLAGYLHTGFRYNEGKLVLLTESDMFGNTAEARKKQKQKSREKYQVAKLSELVPGDYVVHESHGIGIYRGIERITSEGITKDYIKVEYGDGGNLYLPATRLEGIQKYSSAEGKRPKLNKLNSTEWQKTRTRVRHAVQEIAQDLVKLYAARQNAKGFCFGPDTVWQKEFEEMFPYEETADQLLAIDATKQDMMSSRIMDRLICGDVGYGKTEVALRAAFKAVQDSKQVAYLVPTTILAQQIYNTFVERMKGFPVNVALLCRFRTPQQIKQSLKELKAGKVDVVIGTHRLLSKDVEFKDLGLLIIDEEQRFGVTHKEKIKRLKENVDVLTLTATPIPRTLHMSLVGIRDMSVLEEPPIDRLPIQTYVMEYNDELVREAIRRETARGGQVYYVHNRVNNIADIAAHVQQLVPDAHVEYAHGQMSETQLENIMLDFINGEIDVLVSTTIIETGLDIPNANTLIIDDADRMGLSQLYQLRGRVGRSSRTSYAFLMYRRGKLLTEESEKRLKAIKEFTQLGSGIRIAMRDLEIRGAGNVLGAEQHGHMQAVGYDLYCKLLNQAVLEAKGQPVQAAEFETQVECNIDAYIPNSYITDEAQKLDVYKRISAIESEEDYMDMQDELIDRFGNLPVQVENLLKIARLKADAHRCFVTEVTVGRGSYVLRMNPQAEINVAAVPKAVELCHGQLTFAGGSAPMFRFQARNTAEPKWSYDKTIEHIELLLHMIELKKDGEDQKLTNP
jgi:transcription-repair coupling factor (superfamily II helicase)